MKLFSRASFTLLMAGTLSTVTALVVPPGGFLTTQAHSFTGSPCDDPRCKPVDIHNLPKTSTQNLGAQHTSLTIRESSIAIRHISLAIRDTSLALRDLTTLSLTSTTTTTSTIPIVTITMSCWGPSFTPVDGTTFHCSTTIPPVVSGNLNGITRSITVMSDGAPVTTFDMSESSFSGMSLPSITTTRPFTTISNASTTIITPASALTTSMTTLNSTSLRNATASTDHVPTVYLTSLTTVDPPSLTNTITPRTSIHSSATTSASTTDTAQSAGQDSKAELNTLRMALIVGIVVNGILAAIL